MSLVTREAQEKWERERLAPYAMCSADSRGRRHAEDEHSLRTRFQRDRDRVIHCSSFRRLEYKTQVFVNHEGDNYRTRLTHSLEAAQIGGTVARALALNEELTECLALGHDLGHPPFGHAGERAMDELMREHGGFEHNEQTLRVLETLERRYSAFAGLNLTWEVREGIIKHNPIHDSEAPEEYAPGEAPTIEAQLIDLVDEIAYNNHDIDDGLSSDMVTVEQIRQVQLFRDAHDAVLADGVDEASLERHHTVRRIINRCTSDLLGETERRIAEAGLDSIADVRAAPRVVGYTKDMADQVKELKGFLMKSLYRHQRVVRMGNKAGRIVRDLFRSFVSEPLQMPTRFQEKVADNGIHRVACDYIAGMTDRFALEEHRKLFDPLERV